MFLSNINDIRPFPVNPWTVLISFTLTVIIEGFLILLMMNAAQKYPKINKSRMFTVAWSFAWSFIINLITFIIGLALFF